MGTRHSFSEIGDSKDVIISLDHLHEPVYLNRSTKRVTIQDDDMSGQHALIASACDNWQGGT
eukprot:7227340-Pyramimonas_sp.AAC.1